MNSRSKYLVLDFETASLADLKLVGAHEYSVHPSTEVLCAAWKLGTKGELRSANTLLWSPFLPHSPGEKAFGAAIGQVLTSSDIFIVAHSAFFEQCIINNVLGISLPPEKFICTATLAAALAFPRSLEGAGEALGLVIQKDQEGKRLMMKMSKPRRPTKKDNSLWHRDEKDLKRLAAYCATDVDSTAELFCRLPPLNTLERSVWLLDQKINFRGFYVDRPFALNALHLIKEQTDNLNAETHVLTGGEISTTNQREKVWKFVRARGVNIPDITAPTLKAVLADGVVDKTAKRLLEIRQEASKASTAKYKVFEAKSRFDSRCRDNFLYWGASTGRFSGRGAQLQNLPRGNVKDLDIAIELIHEKDLETIKLLYGNPMEVFSSCIRSVVIPRPGYELFVCDYAAIEARVLFWLANHEEGLEAYREGRDLYKEMAAVIYNKSVEEVIKEERNLAKTVVLGAGYGCGAKKFLSVCLAAGQTITEEEAKRAIAAYRSTHSPVTRLWKNLEKAAVMAIENPKKSVSVNHTRWFMDGEILYCELPSLRRLAYYKPEVCYEPHPYNEEIMVPKIYHWAVDGPGKKWARVGTWYGVLVENCFAGKTLILTDSGAKPIKDIRKEDRIFDGYNFVQHGGVICQGEKETGEWLNIRVTPNHLITDGNSWSSVILLDEDTTQNVLEHAQDLARSWLSKEEPDKMLNQIAGVTAAICPKCLLGLFSEDTRLDVETAGIKKRENSEQNTEISSLTPHFSRYGRTGTLELYRDAMIRITKHILIMGGEVLKFTLRGLKIVKNFLGMQKLWTNGMSSDLTSIELTMTKDTFRGTLELSLDKLIRGTDGALDLLFTKIKKFHSCISGKNIAQTGKATMLLDGILKAEKPQNKSWISTGVKEEVFDIQNCGPRNQFMVITPFGPIIAHNCTQAVARDLLVEAMLKIESNGFDIVLHIHDEIVAEAPKGQKSFQEFQTLMSELPEWALGLPIKTEGYVGERYQK